MIIYCNPCVYGKGNVILGERLRMYTYYMKKTTLIISGIILLSALGFNIFSSYIYKEKQASPDNIVQPYRATLSGTFDCLPFKNDGKPHDDMCRFGIKTEAGEWYAVDFNLSSEPQPPMKNGTRFKASGTITPLVYLSTDYWDQFNIEGIFSVTDSLQIL